MMCKKGIYALTGRNGFPEKCFYYYRKCGVMFIYLINGLSRMGKQNVKLGRRIVENINIHYVPYSSTDILWNIV